MVTKPQTASSSLRPGDYNPAKVPIQTQAVEPLGTDSSAGTREMLAAILGRVEQIERTVAALPSATAVTPGASTEKSRDLVSQISNGKGNAVLGLVSNFGGALGFVGTIAVSLLRSLTIAPAATPASIRTLVPVAILTVAMILMVLGGSRIRRRTTRFYVMLTTVDCYSAILGLYLAWLSLTFLRQDTFLNGAFFLLTWGGIFAIARQAVAGTKDSIRFLRSQPPSDEP